MFQDAEDSMINGVSVADVSGADRLAFIRNVYLMMTSGLFVYFLAVAIPLWGVAIENAPLTALASFFVGLPWWANMLVIFGGSMLAQMLSMTRGVNLLAFYGFAALFGFVSIGLVGYALSVGGIVILAQALGLTVVVMGALTIFAFVSRTDFSFLGGFLFMGLMVMIGGVLLGVVLDYMGMPTNTLSLGITIASTLLMMGYILYDTSNIIHRFSTDMVVPAALALMIDFIILFRNILILLLNRR